MSARGSITLAELVGKLDRLEVGRHRYDRRFAAAFVLGCAIAVLLRPAGAQTTMYSATFRGDGSGKFVSDTCRISPHDCNVSLNGTDALPILVNPWEPVSIN